MNNADISNLIYGVAVGDAIALVGCDIYIAVLFALLNGAEKVEAMNFAIEKILHHVQADSELKRAFSYYERLTKGDFIKLPESKISSTGYIVDSLEAALWCFLTTDGYRDCISRAVNLGKDTDSIAAVSGAMAGLYYGNSEESGIPED